MAKNYWMVVTTPENFAITRGMDFTLLGLKAYHRRKVQRIEPGDRVLFYVSQARRFTATATTTSKFYEDETVIWKEEGSDPLNFRIKIRPEIVLNEEQYIDAGQIAPRLDYVRKWIPEDWHMAFLGNLHIFSRRDFALIEGEMKKLVWRRDRTPRRDTPLPASPPPQA